MGRYESLYPKCEEKTCFANEKKRCICLTNNDFGKRKCPFYKPKEEQEKAGWKYERHNLRS